MAVLQNYEERIKELTIKNKLLEKIKANIQEMYISYPVLDKNVCNFYNKVMEIIEKEV